MGVLPDIIKGMNKEEVRHLKIFLNRTNSMKNRKDVKLFDSFRKHYDLDEEKLTEELYSNGEKNAYYRLKNRLLEDIGKSLMLQHFSSQDRNLILHFLTLSRLFQQKGQVKIASHYLEKAEKKALAIQNHGLLDLIYTEFIKLSHETVSVDPEQYIKKQKDNFSKLSQIREIDNVLAVLIHRIKKSQNLSSQDPQIIQILQDTIKDFTDSEDLRQSPQLRFKIYHAISRILLQQHDYKSLEKYLQLTFDEFSKEKLFNKANHDTKLQMLTYLANSFFKNNKPGESQKTAERLKVAMDEYQGIFKEKYQIYYYNILINYYSIVDPDRALLTITEALEIPSVRKMPLNRIFMYIQSALLNFDKGEYKKANKEFVKLKLEDNFLELDNAVQLKVAVAELITRFELDDFEYIGRQLKIVEKDYQTLLAEANYFRQKQMVDILRELISSDKPHSPELKAKAKAVISSAPDNEAADNDILNYNDWLRKKLV